MSSNVALVVEDEPVVRELVCRMMRSAGFTPLAGVDGQAVLELLSREGLTVAPALVVTDINMPRLDGVTMVHKLRSLWPALPAVFVTGNPSWADRAAVVGEVVLKPFGERALLGAARRAILSAALDAALSRAGGDMGNVQILDGSGKRLTIEVQRGFAEPFLRFFQSIGEGLGACAAALSRGERVTVEDVRESAIFRDSPALDVMLGAQAQAVQSTPLLGSDDRVLGVLSTHYREPHHFELKELGPLDEIAGRTARLLELLA